MSPSPPSHTQSDDHSSTESQNYALLSPESPGPTSPFTPPQFPTFPHQRGPSQGQDAPLPPTRSASTSFTSSPLNPNYRSRPSSSLSVFNRLASEDAATLANTSSGQRGSMILYRLAAVDDMGALLPPRNTWHIRDSMASTSDQSLFSLSSDSKYPSGVFAHSRGLIPYAYEPDTDNAPEDDDHLHEPELKDKNEGVGFWSGRGWLNLGALALLIFALLALFICYPVVSYYQMVSRNRRILNGNIRTDGTDIYQPTEMFDMPSLVDRDTPEDAKTRTGWDGQEYDLVFSDEFNVDHRSFYPGDDPYWEAVDLSYWATKDLEWYDPAQITTKGGALRIKMENAPSHDLQYKSGMLQSWNKFCFSSGYFEVSVTFPGPNSNTQGYV